MNSVTISGEVGSGVTTRISNKGKSVSNFELCENGNRHLIAAWEEQSERVKDLQVGDYLLVSGRVLYSKDSSGRGFANIVAFYIERPTIKSEPRWPQDVEAEPIVIKKAPIKKGEY